MKTKQIPAIIMLMAGAITCIVTYQNHYSVEESLKALLLSLVIFLILGVVIKKVLDSFQMPGEDAVNDEGEIIEKPLDIEGEQAGMEERVENSEKKETPAEEKEA